jgi:hypothetical protein
MRVYYRLAHNSTTFSSLCSLACNESVLDLCDILDGTRLGVRLNDIKPLLWRYFPIVDPQVDIVLELTMTSSAGSTRYSLGDETLPKLCIKHACDIHTH